MGSGLMGELQPRFPVAVHQGYKDHPHILKYVPVCVLGSLHLEKNLFLDVIVQIDQAGVEQGTWMT